MSKRRVFGIAPALVAAGSTVTKDVPAGHLVFGRVREQASLSGRGAQKIRANKKVRAARKAKEKP